MSEIRLARTRFASHLSALGRASVLLVAGLAGSLILAPSAPRAADFSLRTETTPLAVTIPVDSTTLIRMEANRIRSAIFDKTLMDIQTDQEAGTVYVLPKTEGESTVYLTAVSGDTAAVRLIFDVDAPARTIVLEKEESVASGSSPDPDPVGNLKPLAAHGYSADIKRIVTLMLRGDMTSGEILFSERKNAGPAAKAALAKLIPLKAKLTGVWRSQAIEASHFELRNGTIRPIALDPRALSVAGIYAVALTSQTLMPGEKTDLILVEADRGTR